METSTLNKLIHDYLLRIVEVIGRYACLDLNRCDFEIYNTTGLMIEKDFTIYCRLECCTKRTYGLAVMWHMNPVVNKVNQALSTLLSQYGLVLSQPITLSASHFEDIGSEHRAEYEGYYNSRSGIISCKQDININELFSKLVTHMKDDFQLPDDLKNWEDEINRNSW